MLEAEPMLFWKIKEGGVWKFQKARAARLHGVFGDGLVFALEPPRFTQSESDESEGEDE